MQTLKKAILAIRDLNVFTFICIHIYMYSLERDNNDALYLWMVEKIIANYKLNNMLPN